MTDNHQVINIKSRVTEPDMSEPSVLTDSFLETGVNTKTIRGRYNDSLIMFWCNL